MVLQLDQACADNAGPTRIPRASVEVIAGAGGAEALRGHQQIGVLLYQIIFISLYYTHYDTIICHYDTIMSLIFLQMSRLLFFIISLSPK